VRYLEDKAYKLQKVEIFRETYCSEYKDGRELPMSCGPESGFSAEERVDEAALQQVLQAAAPLAGDSPMLYVPNLISAHSHYAVSHFVVERA
jgi:hypothetical protein